MRENVYQPGDSNGATTNEGYPICYPDRCAPDLAARLSRLGR
jgi:hypothetical protein